MAAQVWRRGDGGGRQNDFGFVVADMYDRDEHLVVRWQSGVEEIHRNKIGDIRKFTESEISALGVSPLKDLEKLEALDRIEAAAVERSRTTKTAREKQFVDDLIARAYGPQCEWDKKNANSLIVLAIKPDVVGWGFKIRERIHRPIHWLFHRRK